MPSYDLDTDQTFEFTLGGSKYEMRYPNSEEMDALGTIASKNDELTTQLQKKPGNAALVEQVKIGNDELQNKMYELIRPLDEGSPCIADALKTVGLSSIRKFGAMIKKELSLEAE